MPENITEKEALRREADPRDNLIESLSEMVARANLRLISHNEIKE